jgi:hypothetical protein
MSGFPLSFVGSPVGFWSVPDIDASRTINSLRGKCRVCRVLIGVESVCESQSELWQYGNHRQTSGGGIPSLDSGWTPNVLRLKSAICKSLRNLVGPPRFELGTSCTPSKHAQNCSIDRSKTETSVQLTTQRDQSSLPTRCALPELVEHMRRGAGRDQ